MKHGSLFSGIGGFDLAAQWMGWENVFHCEIDTFCQKILQKHFKESKLFKNIHDFDGTPYKGTIDIISGGFPCQPFSVSGKRLGANDDRFLWPEMLRVIKEINPYWVVGENVTGINSMELENCCTDLENSGYEIQPFVISACCTGVDQDRKRTWIVAYNTRRQQKEPHKREVLHIEKSQVDAYRPEPISVGGRADNGFSKGMDECKRIGALANAIVPQVAYEIFKAIDGIVL